MEIFKLIDTELARKASGLRGGGKSFVLLAIDGRCGSGKSTLAKGLASRYTAAVVHMDDFFLRPEQRSLERLSQPGGNVDWERFIQQVLLPLKEGRDEFEYQRYDCSRQKLGQTVHILRSPLMIVEGAYSVHPRFGDIYDIRIFMDIDPAAQRERILKRNGPKMLSRFVDDWIPKEEAYFETYSIKEKCDLCLTQMPRF